jgi:hypothetical protein
MTHTGVLLQKNIDEKSKLDVKNFVHFDEKKVAIFAKFLLTRAVRCGNI